MDYEKPSVTVDIAVCSIIRGELNVLLIKRKNPPFKGSWALPGGFLDVAAKESLEETAARELQEETSLNGIIMEQLKTYGDPGRDPRTRVITVAYYAMVPYTKVSLVKAGDDAAEVQWFPLRKLPELAFDHRIILSDILIRLSN